MKYLTTCILLLAATSCLGFGGLFLGGGVEDPAGGCAYVFCETFDDSGYDNATWTESGGIVNEDYTTSPAPLEGTQSILMDDSGSGATTYTTFTASSNVYVYLTFYGTDITNNGVPDFMAIQDSSGNNLLLLRLQVNSGDDYLDIRCPTLNETAVGSLPINDPTEQYHLWIEYEKGTGVNAKCRVYIAASDTKPGTADIDITSGAGQVDGARFMLISDGTDRTDYVADDLKIDSSIIGSNP